VPSPKSHNLDVIVFEGVVRSVKTIDAGAQAMLLLALKFTLGEGKTVIIFFSIEVVIPLRRAFSITV